VHLSHHPSADGGSSSHQETEGHSPIPINWFTLIVEFRQRRFFLSLNLKYNRMISRTKISDIVNKIASNYNPERIFLFGSYANDSANEDSDLDFIIIKQTDTPKHKRGREVRRFLLGSMVPIDLKIYTPKEFDEEKNINYSFLNSAIKGAKVLYERKD